MAATLVPHVARAGAASVRTLWDVPYGPDPLQRMDVYLPPAHHPIHGVMLMVHGGGWKHGDKRHGRVVTHKLQRWVPRGIALVSVNYRLLPSAPVLTQADDVRHAVAQAQRLAPQWGAPADRFVLMGHSAGAHLVALVSSHPAPTWALGARPWVGVVSLDSAALDVPALMAQRHLPLYDEAFGRDPGLWHAASPRHQLQAGVAPSLLVCSTERPDRPCLQAQNHAATAHRWGNRSEVLPQALSHADINGQLGLSSAYTEAVERFLASLHPAWALALKKIE